MENPQHDSNPVESALDTLLNHIITCLKLCVREATTLEKQKACTLALPYDVIKSKGYVMNQERHYNELLSYTVGGFVKQFSQISTPDRLISNLKGIFRYNGNRAHPILLSLYNRGAFSTSNLYLCWPSPVPTQHIMKQWTDLSTLRMVELGHSTLLDMLIAKVDDQNPLATLFKAFQPQVPPVFQPEDPSTVHVFICQRPTTESTGPSSPKRICLDVETDEELSVDFTDKLTEPVLKTPNLPLPETDSYQTILDIFSDDVINCSPNDFTPVVVQGYRLLETTEATFNAIDKFRTPEDRMANLPWVVCVKHHKGVFPVHFVEKVEINEVEHHVITIKEGNGYLLTHVPKELPLVACVLRWRDNGSVWDSYPVGTWEKWESDQPDWSLEYVISLWVELVSKRFSNAEQIKKLRSFKNKNELLIVLPGFVRVVTSESAVKLVPDDTREFDDDSKIVLHLSEKFKSEEIGTWSEWKRLELTGEKLLALRNKSPVKKRSLDCVPTDSSDRRLVDQDDLRAINGNAGIGTRELHTCFAENGEKLRLDFHPHMNGRIEEPNIVQIANENTLNSSVEDRETFLSNLLLTVGIGTAAVIMGVLAKKTWKMVRRRTVSRRTRGTARNSCSPQQEELWRISHQPKTIDLEVDRNKPDPRFVHGLPKESTGSPSKP
eukprot:GHVT01065390.1.p1 GENE.GHVT01065390.1~~GHVT01065390.1.p1  ORF type:complete len:664 (+),score=19.34 GHVT01065390.1:333-2324(+)